MSDLRVTYEQLLNSSAAMSDLQEAVQNALMKVSGDVGVSLNACSASTALDAAFPNNSGGTQARRTFTTSAESMLQAAGVLGNAANIWSGSFTELVQVFEAMDVELAKEG